MHHVGGNFLGNGGFYSIARYRNSFTAFGSWFLTINQSYFMCVFFFIGGYFAPSSLEKRGVKGFIAGKVKRLGIVSLEGGKNTNSTCKCN